MVLTREYRICMPMTVEEYNIGQIYTLARRTLEESENGEGAELIATEDTSDPVHGAGEYTEMKIQFGKRLPYWVQLLMPTTFYLLEKSWNYYPYKITEYSCPLSPRFHITIKTRYEDNNGSSDNCLGLNVEQLDGLQVEFIDIAYDKVSAKHYKESEDLRYFRSRKTGRGPLAKGWMNSFTPMMCSYKAVHVKYEVWGLQTKMEEFMQSWIREILLVGHRQAFAWIDEWIDMTLEDVKVYTHEMQVRTDANMNSSYKDNKEAEGSKLQASSSHSKIQSTPSTVETSSAPSSPKRRSSWSQ